MKRLSYALVLATALARAEPQQILISTKVPGQRVRELQAKLNSYLDCKSPESCEEAQRQREPSFSRLRTIIAEFVVDQLNAEPRLERVELFDQLERVLGSSEGDEVGHLYVFRSPPSWSPNETEPIVWSIVYRAEIYVGTGGARTTIDAYVVDRGRARFVGRGGAEMSGYGETADGVRNPSPNSLSILIHGRLEWASGHELPAKATLYGVSPAGIRTI